MTTETQNRKIQNLFDRITTYFGNSARVKINSDNKIIKIAMLKSHFIIVDRDKLLERAKFKMWLEKHFLYNIDLCLGIDDETEKYYTIFLYY